MRRAVLLICALLALVAPARAASAGGYEAAPTGTEEPIEVSQDLSYEIERQIALIDLEGFEEYFDEIGGAWPERFHSAAELLRSCAEGGDGETSGVWEMIEALFQSEFKRSLSAAAVLTGAALLTALAGSFGDRGKRNALSLILCSSALTLTAAALASLCSTAKGAVSRIADLSDRAAPVMTTLLVSMGSPDSAGIFRPLMLFLSGTVIKMIEKIVMPLVLAGGVLSLIDPLTNGSRFSRLACLMKKLAKWILGLLSSLYFGITALRGLTSAAYDGVTLRTAKYAVDKLVPIVGGMVGGTVDSVMGCALLIKNGLGYATVILLLAAAARPLIVLASGIFVFRTASALSQPAADARAVGLFDGAAEVCAYLFACVAASGCMLVLTVLVFIAAGGVTAGLW